MHGSISKNLKLKFEIFIKFTLLRFFFSNFVKNILKQSKNQNSHFAKIIFVGPFTHNYDHQASLFCEKMDFV